MLYWLKGKLMEIMKKTNKQCLLCIPYNRQSSIFVFKCANIACGFTLSTFMLTIKILLPIRLCLIDG